MSKPIKSNTTPTKPSASKGNSSSTLVKPSYSKAPPEDLTAVESIDDDDDEEEEEEEEEENKQSSSGKTSTVYPINSAEPGKASTVNSVSSAEPEKPTGVGIDNIKISAPTLDNFNGNENALREVPSPIVKKLDLPDFVPAPEEEEEEKENFGKKSNKKNFSIFAYINTTVFFAVAVYSLVVGFIIFFYRYPIGLSAFVCFFIAFIIAAAAVVQLVGYLTHTDKPAKHMFVTVVVNFLLFSALLASILQIIMEKDLFEFAKESFKIRFNRYSYRFDPEDIDKIFKKSVPLTYTLIAIIIVAATVCVILAMIQCCYYVPLGWWNLIGCIILPVIVVILGITVGVIFLCLALFATPFAHTDETLGKLSKDSPAGYYLQRSAIILLCIAAGLVVYIIVVFIIARCYYSHLQTKKEQKGLGWPDTDKVTYAYFRKKDFELPFSSMARNALAILLGIVSIAVIVVIIVFLPRDKFTVKNGEDYVSERCDNFADFPCNFAEISSLSLSSSSFMPLGHNSPPSNSNTSQSRHSLGFKENHPCKDAIESICVFLATYHGDDLDTSTTYVKALPLIIDMTESARKLVVYTSILVVVPLAPVVIVVLLVLVLLVCAICCFSLVSVCLCDPSDTRGKIERDILEWETQRDEEAIVRQEDHSTLKKQKRSIEERIKKFNDKLTELQNEHAGLDGQIVALKTEADEYEKTKDQAGAGARYDKLLKGRETLNKTIKKFNEKVEKLEKVENVED